MLLSQLKKALEPIVKLSKAETVVDVAGIEVHLRLLSPEEELDCQQEAQALASSLEEETSELEDLSRTKAMRFLDSFRIGILSRSIVQIGDLDLRETPFVETGEVLPSGVAVKVTKTQAVRDMLSDFPRAVQMSLMQEFHILTESVSQVIEKNIETSFSDDEAELLDLEDKVAKKKAYIAQKKSADGNQDEVRNLMRTTAKGHSFVEESEASAEELEAQLRAKKEEEEKALKEEREAMEIQQMEEQPKPERKPIFPNSARPIEPIEQKQHIEEQPEQTVKTEPTKEPLISQEQQMPEREQPQSNHPELKGGLEVYRLPSQDLGSVATQHNPTKTPKSSRNPRYRPPNK